MSVDDVVRPDVRTHRPGPSASHQLVVGPDDGYGDVALERLSLAGAVPWNGSAADGDRLVVVLAGHARVTVQEGPAVTLAPNEVVQVGRGRSYLVEVLGGGTAGVLELLVLSGPGP